jgi:hypothetical protein
MDKAEFFNWLRIIKAKISKLLLIHLPHLIIAMSLLSAASLISDYLIDEYTIKIDENMYKSTMYEIASVDTQATKISTYLSYVQSSEQDSEGYEQAKKDCENAIENYTEEYKNYQYKVDNQTKSLSESRDTRRWYLSAEKILLMVVFLLNTLIYIVVELIKDKRNLKEEDRDEEAHLNYGDTT